MKLSGLKLPLDFQEADVKRAAAKSCACRSGL